MEEKKERINQSQFYNLITGEEVSWQAIIYDLIKTEQLDPWDIDIGVLAEKYVVIIQQIEEANFFVSSKVLLACSLLLRLKSEILTNQYIQSLDDAIYGAKEQKKYVLERIDLDEDELPLLVPRTPMPRFKKVTLKELMGALHKAIETENRRIKKEIKVKQAERSALVVLPNKNRIPLKEMIRGVLSAIKGYFETRQTTVMKYSELAPTREEKLASFLPILHLSNQEHVYIKQEKHYEEIFLALEKLKEESGDLVEHDGTEEIIEENSDDGLEESLDEQQSQSF